MRRAGSTDVCDGQPYCLDPYVRRDDMSEFSCIVRVSLVSRESARSVVGPWIIADWLPDIDGWCCWAACDFPIPLRRLGLPDGVAGLIMDEATDGLSQEPVVAIPLDGALVSVELIPREDTTPVRCR